MPRRLLIRFRAPLGTLIFGLLLGISLGLSLETLMFSKPPVISLGITEKEGNNGVVVAGGILETRYHFVRRRQCNSVSQTWLWKWINEGTGDKRRYFVPLAVSPVTLSDASPVIQDFVVALPLPRAVLPGEWFVRYKALDYCNIFAWMFGPSIRVSKDEPVTVLPQETTNEPAVHRTAALPDGMQH